MGAGEVVGEDEHGNEVVGNIIVETLHADVLEPIQRLNRHLVGRIAVVHNGLRSSHRGFGFQYSKILWAIPVVVQMDAEHKAGFAVQNELEVVLLALYLDHRFIDVPLVRDEIQRRNGLYGNFLEDWDEAGPPVTDGNMRYPDIHHCTQNQSDIVERLPV